MCQNISNENLLAAFITQAKNFSEDCVQGEGQSFTLSLRRKREGTLEIVWAWYWTQTKSYFGNHQCLRFHIWFIMTLYYKKRQALLQNVTAILLQNVPGVLLQNAAALLQNASILLQNARFIRKCVYNYVHIIAPINKPITEKGTARCQK